MPTVIALAGPIDNEIDITGFLDMPVYGTPSDTSWGVQSLVELTAIVFGGTGFGGYEGNHPTTGTINSIRHYDVSSGFAVETNRWTGFNVSVAALIPFIEAEDSAGVANLLFGGNDSFGGSLVYDDNIWGYGGNDSITLALGGGGLGDYVNGGEGNDSIFVKGMATGDVFDGGNGVDSLVITGGVVINAPGFYLDGYLRADFWQGSAILNMEVITFFSTGNQVAELSSDRFGAGLISPTAFVVPDAHANIIDIVVFEEIDLSGWTFHANWNPIVNGNYETNVDFVHLHGSLNTDDNITATIMADRIEGFEGDDVIHGGGGGDSILSGTDRDEVYGEAGNDFIQIENEDVVSGEIFDGGADTDRLVLLFELDTTKLIDVTNCTIASFEQIEFESFDFAPVQMTFALSAAQAATGLAANLLVIGSEFGSTADIVSITAAAQANLNLSGWTFENWTGNDRVVVIGSNAADTITGTSGIDMIRGGNAGDVIDAGAGNDFIVADGMVLADSFDGNGGSDTLVVERGFIEPGDWPTHYTSDFRFGALLQSIEILNFANPVGFLTLQDANKVAVFLGSQVGSGLSTTLNIIGAASRTDVVQLFANGTLNLSGWTFGAGWTARTGAVLPEGEDSVVVKGSANVDTVTGTTSGDWLSGAAGNDVLSGAGGHDLLNGNDDADTLNGGAGNDILDGGNGGDTMAGGADNDFYYVNNVADAVNEFAGSGTDTVETTITYTLTTNVENLTLAVGAGNINGTGNTLNNTIQGNAGNNVLDGGAGADTMLGGAGNDTYIVGGAGDVVSESAGQGTDLVLASVNYALTAEVENLTLTGTDNLNAAGNGIANVITGNAGNNTINGGAGADTMIGGQGNDYYIVDNVSDTVSEGSSTGGLDVVQSSVTFSLVGMGYIENVQLTGASNINATGNFQFNRIWGNDGVNTIDGAGGDDILDGGLGADTLIGGQGNDYFHVDNNGDNVVELGSQGTDTLQANITYTLSDNVENMVLGTSTNINGTGNALNNRIQGNMGANTLDGGIGADQLIGGFGGDNYIIDNAGDTVSEGSATGGYDRVFSSVTYTLVGTGYTEDLMLTGAADINGTGNFADNHVHGNSGDNTINGGTGNDFVMGADGNDILIGGSGVDIFGFTTANGATDLDTISDYSVADDSIGLSLNTFNVNSGTLAAGAFVTGSAAADADDRIIYDSATGALYYDADGDGAGAAVQIATMAAGLSLTNADFFGYTP